MAIQFEVKPPKGPQPPIKEVKAKPHPKQPCKFCGEARKLASRIVSKISRKA